MEATLKLGNFQELTHDELMLVDGGSWAQVGDAFVGILFVCTGIVAVASGNVAGGGSLLMAGGGMLVNLFN